MPPPITPPSRCCAGLKVTGQGQHSRLSLGLSTPPPPGDPLPPLPAAGIGRGRDATPTTAQGAPGGQGGGRMGLSVASPPLEVHPVLPPQALCPAFPRRGPGWREKGCG